MSGASGVGCRFLCGPVVFSVQPEFVGFVSMGSFGTDVFVTDFWAVFDEVPVPSRAPDPVRSLFLASQ